MGYIYLLIDKRNGKKYVGKHNGSDKNYWSSGLIPKRIKKKHGKLIFERIIIETDIPHDLLNEKEIFYIEKYNSFSDGYNLSTGGDGADNWIMKKSKEELEEIFRKNSERQKGRVFSEKTKKLMSQSGKKKIFTENHKKNISKSLTGKVGRKHTESTKNKLSLIRKGVKNPKHSQFMQKNNPKSQKVSIEGVIYNTIKEACIVLNKERWLVKNRLNTEKYKEWFRI